MPPPSAANFRSDGVVRAASEKALTHTPEAEWQDEVNYGRTKQEQYSERGQHVG
jgi:hypothetical protein